MSLPANPEALARCVEKGFAAADLRRVFTPAMSEADALRELVSINQEIDSIAVSMAKATLLKANEMRALLEAKGVREQILFIDL